MGRVRLVDWLRRERDQRVGGGLYYNTQILFAYNSNHMEGSTLSLEQTSQLYDTGALLSDGADDRIRADDVVGTRNHFRAFAWILDHADEPVGRAMVCALHAMLWRGTGREFDPDRNVGGYKVLPNVTGRVMGVHTVLPADVPRAMERVFALYRDLRDDPYGMALAHWMFETTHPFSDGNGRIGRLVMFKELLRLDAMPVIVRDADRQSQSNFCLSKSSVILFLECVCWFSENRSLVHWLIVLSLSVVWFSDWSFCRVIGHRVGVGHSCSRCLFVSSRVHGTRILFPEGRDFNAWSGKFEFRGWVSWRADIYLHNRGPSAPLKSGLNRFNTQLSRFNSGWRMVSVPRLCRWASVSGEIYP